MSGERPDEAKEDEVDEGSQRARMLPISVNQTAESGFGAPQGRQVDIAETGEHHY
jgi:hypothetical protein